MTWTMRVDWPSCAARGLCAELLPERIHLDEWGFPVVEGTVTPDLLGLAKAVPLRARIEPCAWCQPGKQA